MSISNTLEKIESAKFVILGNVDSGKSSFIGVMKHGILDDGNGFARSFIVKLKHEIDTGRTSSHAFHYLIKNNEITTLVDLCGHEKYLKTTIFGVMGLFCDYAIIMIGANMGISKMTLEHLALIISNRIPFIIIITKIDICPNNILTNLKKDLEKIIKRNKKKIIYFEKNEEQIDNSYLKHSHQLIIDTLQNRGTLIIPVIMTSNKTGYNINFIREFIMAIHSTSYLEKMNKNTLNNDLNDIDHPLIMYIDSIYNVPGIGIVLSGVVKYGHVSIGDKVYLGPINNIYIPISVKSIHNCISENISKLEKNESGSIAIRLHNKNKNIPFKRIFHKGQIVTSNIEFANRNTFSMYNCDIAVFNHPTTIRNGYQPIIYCKTIRQTCKFIIDDNKILRSNSKENINIKFIRHSEFILPNTIFMFTDGKTKGIGRINYGILTDDISK